MKPFPDSLSNLATGAFVKYVSQLLKHLVTFMRSSENADAKQKSIQQACRCLGELIESIPPVYINDIVVRLLNGLNVAFHEQAQMFNYNKVLQKVVNQIVYAILHPSLTTLECFEMKEHLTVFDYYKVHQSDLIFLALPHLKNLKVLKLGHTAYKRNLSSGDISKNLERFSFHGCCNQDLEILSNSCKNLRSLDISNSGSLTNSVASSILKFRHLEELIMEDVSLTRRGQRKILKGFAEMEISKEGICENSSSTLKKLSCFNPSDTDVRLLADKFQNLISLSLDRVKDCNLSLLKTMKQLTALKFRNSNFPILTPLLSAIGHQLLCLHLENVYLADFFYLAEHCTSVRCLELDFSDSEYLHCWSSTNISFPKYPSVTCLHISSYCDSTNMMNFLSCCPNVSELYVKYVMHSTLFQSVIKREVLTHLEQFLWYGNVLLREKDFLVQFSDLCVVIYELRRESTITVCKKYVVSYEEIQDNSKFFFHRLITMRQYYV